MKNGEIRMPRRPSLPTEQVIHYIVKDYRRMYNTYDKVVMRADKAEEESKKWKAKYEEAKSHLEGVRKGYAKNLQEVRESRSAAIEVVTEDLKEQVSILESRLKEQVRKNKLLAQAVVSPENAQSILSEIEEPLIISSDIDKDRLGIAMKQLETIMLRLNSVEMRIQNVERVAKEHYNEDQLKTNLKKFNAAFGKIDSAVLRIENFLERMKNVKVK